MPDETIVADYDLTSIFWAQPRVKALEAHLAEHGIPVDRVLPFLQARTPVLRRALHHIHDQWGSYDGYATDCLGLPASFPRARSALTI